MSIMPIVIFAGVAFVVCIFLLGVDSESPIVSIFSLLFCACFFVFFLKISIPEPAAHCDGCGVLIGSEEYCAQCGYEIMPHCIECGELCNTAFCKLCGAEQ